MATSYTYAQVPPSSYDDSAVSVAVADRSTTDYRAGAFFTEDFAAVSPVYFHNLGGGKFFGIFAQRWHTATRPSNVSDPNLFNSYTVDSEPSWAIFDGVNGNRYAIPGQSPTNPDTDISYDTRSVVAACSRTSNYLYLLQSFTESGSTFGVVSHFHISPLTGEVNLVGEQSIPNVVTADEQMVTFNRGVKYNITYLTFVGTDSSGKIYYARKNWGSIGRLGKIEYQSDKGWTEDYSKIAPLKTSGGYLTTAGPVSFADYRGKTWISTVKNDGGTMTAQLYVSSGALWDVWTPDHHPYPLGTQGTTYMGGTAYLQPMLRANASAVAPSCVTGIPLVYATKVISGDNSSIKINWDLWPIKSSGLPSTSSEASLSVNSESTAHLS